MMRFFCSNGYNYIIPQLLCCTVKLLIFFFWIFVLPIFFKQRHSNFRLFHYSVVIIVSCGFQVIFYSCAYAPIPWTVCVSSVTILPRSLRDNSRQNQPKRDYLGCLPQPRLRRVSLSLVPLYEVPHAIYKSIWCLRNAKCCYYNF